jgi:hypothetical protein
MTQRHAWRKSAMTYNNPYQYDMKDRCSRRAKVQGRICKDIHQRRIAVR